MKRLFSLLLLLPLAFLAACAPQEAALGPAEADLDARFVAHFQLTDEELALLDDSGINTLNIRIEHGDTAFYLRQIIGNAYVIYLAVDAVGPDAFINHVEFPGLNIAFFGLPSTLNEAVTIYYQQYPLSGYIIRLSSRMPLDTSELILMELSRLTFEWVPSTGFVTPDETLFGPAPLPFVPNVNAAVREMPIVGDSGEKIGTLSVSPFHAQLMFLDVDIRILSELWSPRLVMDDGTYRAMQGFPIGQSRDYNGIQGIWSLWDESRQLWEPDRIVALELGDVRIEFD